MSMHICFLLGVVWLLIGRSGNEEKVRPCWGHVLNTSACIKKKIASYFENIREVQKIGSGRTKGDVGCDRMVFAINSDLLLMQFNSFFNKWSLDQGQKTINLLIPY